jgi:hypothetical protein
MPSRVTGRTALRPSMTLFYGTVMDAIADLWLVSFSRI